MNIRPLLLLVCTLWTSSLFAAPAEQDIFAWLRVLGSPNAGSREVFDALHTKAEPAKTFIKRVEGPLLIPPPAIYPLEFRSSNGSSNNINNLGTAGFPDLRNTTNAYADGVGSPAGADRLSARDISNKVDAQIGLIPNSLNISSFVWQWGQFVDHDMSLTRTAVPTELFNIPVPKGDPQFDPRGLGNKVLPFQRSEFKLVNGIREQVNGNSAFIDASVVYGSDLPRANELRTFEGGHLKTSTGNLLPFNVDGFPNQPQTRLQQFFLAGDVRANENTGLAVVHTLFMREHNFWADSLAFGDPSLLDEDLYRRARAIVGAEIQLVTYRDFIPILLGPNALTPYAGYNFEVDPTIALVFSTAAFRIGHSLLPQSLLLFNKQGIQTGETALERAIFQPNLVTTNGIEPYLRGLALQRPQEVDAYMIDAMRNFLVGGARTQGFDLAALNIQRGRDHGLPGYNQVRIDYGLSPKASFAEITSDVSLQDKLTLAYTSPDNVDIWVGGISEDHVNGGLVGETFFTILKEQFERTRDGDRFWYESYLDTATLATVQQQTLGTILKRNAAIGHEVPDDVFHVASSP